MFSSILLRNTFEIFSIFSQADLSFEEKQKEKIGIHFNKSEWMTKDLFNLELLTIGQMEKLTHPVLKEIRVGFACLNNVFLGINKSLCYFLYFII